MKISASNIELNASHSYTAHEETNTSLESWRININAAQDDNDASTPITLSSTGQTLSSQAAALASAQEAADNDPLLLLLKQMLEWMTGQPIKLFSATDLPAQDQQSAADALPLPQTSRGKSQAPAQRSGSGMAYDYHRVYTESESTQVTMAGTVRTADGQEIQLSMGLSMSRSYREETHISVQTGNARRQDPLVINFAGTAAQLRDQRFSFDLNGDGSKENIARLASGSGYLAFDRNGNGRIDNGLELFGPATNSGFGELAQLDSDHNGWIDENDAAYRQLSVWTPDEDGQGSLQSLAKLQIGALYTGHVASPFELRGSNNNDLGAIGATGLYLREDGSSGTLQELDLTV